MKSVNRFIIHGNVDPVMSFEKGMKVNIAANRAPTDEKWARKEVTNWVQVTNPDEKQAAWAAENAKASDVVLAKGGIGNDPYQKDSEMVYSANLVGSTFNVFPKAQCRLRSSPEPRRSPAS